MYTLPASATAGHTWHMSLLANQEHVELAGERRLLCPDLNMAAALHERVGAHWLLWLAERWIGRPVKVEGKPARQLEPVKPAELAMVLYALLQTDREMAAERGEARAESEATIRRRITLANLDAVQTAVTKAILQCFLAPGEGVESVAHAAGEAPGSEAAQTSGAGRKSSR